MGAKLSSACNEHVSVGVGSKLPAITCFEGSPNGKVDMATLFEGKRGVLFAVPGAFTPG